MRRAAVTRIDLEGVDFERKRIATVEKGGFACEYRISAGGLQAIRDYLAHERGEDSKYFDAPTLFLPAHTVARSASRLHPKAVNDIWSRLYLPELKQFIRQLSQANGFDMFIFGVSFPAGIDHEGSIWLQIIHGHPKTPFHFCA